MGKFKNKQQNNSSFIKTQGKMFRRCHRLKKSHINIPTSLRQPSTGKPVPIAAGDKQNITINYAYSNVQLTRSIELTKSQTLITTTNRPSKCCDLTDRSSKLEKVKSLCGQIETLNHKIQMYKDILAAKESRHNRNRNKKMEEKEEILQKMIEQYQSQRKQNELLIKQLGSTLGHKNSFSLDRRTTATFQFYADS